MSSVTGTFEAEDYERLVEWLTEERQACEEQAANVKDYSEDLAKDFQRAADRTTKILDALKVANKAQPVGITKVAPNVFRVEDDG